MYDRLGLLAEDERETTERQETVRQSDEFNDELPCTDCIPQERVFECNRSNPVMKIGSLYKDMKEFRLAIRQYAINNEFELGIESSSPFRYRAYCKGGDCPWRINARLQNAGSPTVVVTVIVDKHTCTSSGRRKTTTPTSSWVASLAMPFLTKKPHMGAKELQNTLQEQHNWSSGNQHWPSPTSKLTPEIGTASFPVARYVVACCCQCWSSGVVQNEAGHLQGTQELPETGHLLDFSRHLQGTQKL